MNIRIFVYIHTYMCNVYMYIFVYVHTHTMHPVGSVFLENANTPAVLNEELTLTRKMWKAKELQKVLVYSQHIFCWSISEYL